MGADIKAACLKFLDDGCLPLGLNDTFTVLIPKVKAPSSMSDFRPISLCNMWYKVVVKVLANRIKLILLDIVGPYQRAFVPRRNIIDNFLIGFEVLHYLKRRSQGNCGSAALKLDMSKAYYRLEWPFLRTVLERLGFPSHWVSLLMHCVSLSAELCGVVHGCRVAHRASSISHLFFANDSLLFFKTVESEALVVKDILHTYEVASGQSLNLHKPQLFFSSNTLEGTQSLSQFCWVLSLIPIWVSISGYPILLVSQRRRFFALLK